MRRRSPGQIIDCLIWEGWDPSCAFNQGARKCLDIRAPIIRDTVRLLLARPELPTDVKILTASLDLTASDDALETRWRSSIRALLTLFHASPVGTERQRGLLLDIARDTTFVAALLTVAESRGKADPNWIAVFAAEGSERGLRMAESHREAFPGAAEIVERFRRP